MFVCLRNRRAVINTLVLVSILVWCAPGFAEQDFYPEGMDAQLLREFEEEKKDELDHEMRDNDAFFKAISRVVNREGGEESKVILSRAKDTRHMTLILNAEGRYIKGLAKIKESNELLLRAINRIKDGISKIGDKELQKKIEVHLTNMFVSIRHEMALLLTKNDAFHTTSMMALKGSTSKKAESFMKRGMELKKRAIVSMSKGEREESGRLIKESTELYIKALTLAFQEKEKKGGD